MKQSCNVLHLCKWPVNFFVLFSTCVNRQRLDYEESNHWTHWTNCVSSLFGLATRLLTFTVREWCWSPPVTLSDCIQTLCIQLHTLHTMIQIQKLLEFNSNTRVFVVRNLYNVDAIDLCEYYPGLLKLLLNLDSVLE